VPEGLSLFLLPDRVSIPLRKFRKSRAVSASDNLYPVSIPLRKFRKTAGGEENWEEYDVSIPLRKFRKASGWGP